MSTTAPPRSGSYAPNGDGPAPPAVPPRGAGMPPTLDMRRLPPRGDLQATRYWVFGIGAYALFSATLVAMLAFRDGRFHPDEVWQLAGLGEHPNLAVTLLVSLGFAVTVIATSRAWLDIGLMRAEEQDVEWVRETREDGLDLVFLDEPERRRLFEARRTGAAAPVPARPGTVETLLDERVRRVQIALASAEGGVVVPAELRGIAEVRTAAYGAFARYASSLLLLLAVLGTFAGVKTALPELIAAIGSNTNDTAGLVNALSAVASAFGGNALALVGAVAVGLMAQGLSLGRRNLLERLELVSAEYLYGRTVAAEASPMQSAVVALRDTAIQMQSASGAMIGIESGLNALSSDFRGSLDGLGDRLREIVVKQEQGMYDRTADAMVDLQRRMESLVRGVDANAQVYAGLAEAVGTRSRETADALRQMRETNQQLADALASVAAAGQRTEAAYAQLEGAVRTLTRGSESADAKLVALAGAVSGMSPTFAALGRTLEAADGRLRASEEASRDGWERVGHEVARQLAEAVEGFRTLDQRAAGTLDQLRQLAVTRTGGASTGGDPEVRRLLGELVAASAGRGARPAWRQAAIPFGAVLVGLTLGGAGTYYLVRPAQEQAQTTAAQLQPTLDRLGAAVERLEAAPPRARAAPDSVATPPARGRN